MGRFLSPEQRERLIAQKQGKPSKAMSALEMALMNNPAYAAIHKAAVDETRTAQRTAETFQDEVELALADVKIAISTVLDEAVTLPSGDKAFLDKDGVAWTADGERVDDALTEGIDWSAHPIREEYLELRGREGMLKDASQTGQKLSNRLGEIYNGLHDDEDPLSADKIEAYREEIKEIETEYGVLGGAIHTSSDLTNEFAPKSIELTADIVPKL